PPTAARAHNTTPSRRAGTRSASARFRCRQRSPVRPRPGRTRPPRPGTASRLPSGRSPSWSAGGPPWPARSWANSRNSIVNVAGGGVIVTGVRVVVAGMVVAGVDVIVTGRKRRELCRPVRDGSGPDQALRAHHPFKGAQPAVVVAPPLPGRVRGFPAADLADQGLPEVLPVDQPAVG